MDIQLKHRGSVEMREDGVRLLIPLLFSHVSSGPRGIWQTTVEDVSLNGVSHRAAVRSHRWHGYSAGDGSIAGPAIEARPIMFRQEDGNSNVLVLDLDLALDGSALGPLAETGRLSLDLDLLLTSHVPLPLRLELKLEGAASGSQSRTLTGVSARRRKLPVLLLANFLLLVGVVLALIVWEAALHYDVYQQSTGLAVQVTTAISGMLLALFGLSSLRWRLWTAGAHQPLSVLRFPELHLHQSAHAALSSPAWLITLCVLGLGTFFVIFRFHTLSVPGGLGADVAVFDSVEHRFVTARRIYRSNIGRHTANGAAPVGGDWHANRFHIACTDADAGGSVPRLFPLGWIDEEGRIQDIDVRVRLHSDSAPLELTQSGRAWLDDGGFAPVRRELRTLLCGPDTSGVVALERSAYLAEVSEEVVTDGRRRLIAFTPRDLWGADEIINELGEIRLEVLRELDGHEPFEQRDELVRIVAKRFADRVPATFSRKPGALADSLIALLHQGASDEEKICQRIILARALLAVLDDYGSLDDLQADKVDELLGLMTRSQTEALGWRVERMGLELALELARRLPTDSLYLASLQTQVEGLMDGFCSCPPGAPCPSSCSDQRYLFFADLLVAGSRVNALIPTILGDLPTREWERFRDWAGPGEMAETWFERRERLGKAEGGKKATDPAVDLADLKADIRQVALRIGTSLGEEI